MRAYFMSEREELIPFLVSPIRGYTKGDRLDSPFLELMA